MNNCALTDADFSSSVSGAVRKDARTIVIMKERLNCNAIFRSVVIRFVTRFKYGKL
jgi:hypothetical protein